MITPVETIADALIAFILSLLGDPEAAEEFHAAPEASMAAHGVDGACLADVKAVAPIIIDHHSVHPVTPVHPYPPTPPDEVIKEITRIINQFTTIDNRSTIVDQSTNQNIWTEGGDVTQTFDQSAVVASGDHSVAAGDDALVDNSSTDVTVGNVAIGNSTDSGNTNIDTDVDASDTTNVAISDSTVDGDLAVANDVSDDADMSAAAAPVDTGAVIQPELMTDMTAADDGGGYADAQPALPAAPDVVEEAMEEQ
ncbi:MAG TPA: IniB N-terminal domain-containing protein [Microbacterium sp.]|nr:IniB N-terminal domain-containing protein [Microbacterium sp.]